MACTRVLVSTTPPLQPSRKKSKVNTPTSCSLDYSSSSSTPTGTTTEPETPKKFSYSRSSPSVRWPHLNLTDTHPHSPPSQFPFSPSPPTRVVDSGPLVNKKDLEGREETQKGNNINGETLEVLGSSRPSKTRVKKMTNMALKRANDWRQRVQFMIVRVLSLKSEEFVGDVLDDGTVEMTLADFCFIVKSVGRSSWQRAMEVYEWLNVQDWYARNPRMLATILGVLGKAKQEALAVEIFSREGSGVGNTVQVYNAMMSVYARTGRFTKVQELLGLMRERGCEPDLVSFNTLINARLKSGPMTPNLAIDLLDDVRNSGIRPDIVTYNTLISACSRESNLKEAVKVYNDMETHKCQPDLWTYNAMISVYGRCGLSSEAERLFKELESKGFFPDAVTYNSLLYAFAREGNVSKVQKICEEMVNKGFAKDEMTYNTMIHMHGKNGRPDMAFQLYRDMQRSSRIPDVVTYTVLVDSLGKANMMSEAADVMSEMLKAGVKPTLWTYSALICGYAKSGNRLEAEKTFELMLRSGIEPDHLAYSVMLDIHLRSNNTTKAMALYHKMVSNGFTPDRALFEVLLLALGKENKEEDIQKVVKDMEECELDLQTISSILVKGECYDYVAEFLRKAILQGYDLDHENLLSVSSSYSLAGRHLEALQLLDFMKEHAPGSHQLITEAAVVIHCKAYQLDAALEEYSKTRGLSKFHASPSMYESLIKSCEETELFAEASQVFSDMRFNGVETSQNLCESMVLMYCKMGFPETAHHLIDQAEEKGSQSRTVSLYVWLIEAYGKLKVLEKAESLVGILRQRFGVVDRKAWNALIKAYAASGCYEKARAAFNTMMRDGPSPSVETINGLFQALIVDGRLDELYVVIQELQDMGFQISKSSILLMLDAFARAGNIFEVKKIYHGMKAAGYFPSMHLYRVMIALLSKGKRVKDVEAMVSEMEEAGFKPDLSIWNSVLKLYTETEDFKKTVRVYQQIQEAGLKPDEETYNTLISMYCRDRRPEEGLQLMHEMRSQGLDPKLDTYKNLIAAFGKQQMVEQAEELFEGLRFKGYKLDRSLYHIMMKIFRSSGDLSKAEKLLIMMKEAGVEPTIATMHLLMVSYGSSGHPTEAEKVLNNLKLTGENLMLLPYSTLIDAYLKNGDYTMGIQKLQEMKGEGLEPDHMIWTSFIRASSLSQSTNEAVILLKALEDAGFHLPLRLLTEKSESLVLEVDQCLAKLEHIEDNAAFNFVNALEDLLWAFELRATASWVFQLAIRRSIYCHDVFRVADKDWGADFRKLSAGAALVGLTLWLDHMQDASLEGFPESPKSVGLVTGTSEYNKVSLNSTLKAYLWEMGSPFLPSKTRSGLLVAKAHSLRMWLKDSPFCLDLELKNSPYLPEVNSMQLVEGCFMRRGLVPAFKDINEKLGQVKPKKFARLALLSDTKRKKVIQADIDGRQEKLAKLRKRGVTQKKKINKFGRGKSGRRPMISKFAGRNSERKG
ncbi:pentatricopeptide repeat-containing protein At3g18110, chloroplastic [Rhododendron vialii]|uniref:pentatricopeptide repeat-containing protein At3g18110, chloroplastic n=1 Tax=Rhododendron vialii TaxID=182163 RepID=UPI00265F3D83|nr:pentatricopeptide repeat-containing protein At3g18110, chloroplastic [Rhododendron vialii]